LAIQRKKLIIWSGAFIVVVSTAMVYRWSDGSSSYQIAQRPSALVAKAAPSNSETPVNNTVPAAASATGKKVGSMNYRKTFAESNDYWAYAKKILPAARAGDPDAQFYLSRLLERCEEGNRMYFQKRGKALTLDEGLQFAVQRHLPMEMAQAVFDKCHEFQDHDLSDLGSAGDWLAKATAAGQPLAEATTASKIFTQELMQNFARARGVPEINTQPESGADPRALLRAAVASGDPEVLFEIGDMQSMLDPAGIDNGTKRLAWWLVACERGLDCSTNAEWVKNTCAMDPQCASVGGPTDIVQMLAGENWPNVQQYALDISEKLDAGQLEDLGIGS
jgi:hypothetical protein